MKRIRTVAFVSALLIWVAGCGQSGNVTKGETAAAESASSSSVAEEETGEVEEAQMAMLEGLLSENLGEDADKLRECCTEDALNQLRDAYDYDSGDEDPLAVWDINGRKAPNDSQIALASLKRTAPNTYQARFEITSGSQKGESWMMEYTLAEENGRWKIASYRKI